MIAESVANALGVELEDTNINCGSAWRKGQKVRQLKADQIKISFVCLDKVVVRRDGKTLMLRGNIKLNRVCVYLSGIYEDNSCKLLGIPDCKSGRGASETSVGLGEIFEGDSADTCSVLENFCSCRWGAELRV